MSPWPTQPDAQRRTQAMAKLASLLKSLSTVINDRQPDSQKQTPETEWRRQRDLSLSINTVRDVLSEIIRLVQDGGLAQLVVKGQLLSSNGSSEVPVDPPRTVTNPTGISVLVNDPTSSSPTGIRWDSTAWQKILDAASVAYVDAGDASTAAAAAAALAAAIALLIHADGSVAFTADQSFGTHKGTNVGSPSAAGDIAPKGYVDSFSTRWLPPVAGATKGDIVVFNGTAWVALPVGSNGQVLTANSGAAAGVEWATP